MKKDESLLNSILNDNINEIRKLKAVLFELRLKYDNINNDSLKSDVKTIIQTGDKVYAELVKNNVKASSAHRFINYYLPTIDKIVGRYNEFVKNNIKSKESIKVQQEVIEFMPKVKEALVRYYESMFSSEILDTSVELDVLLRLV